MRFRVKTTHSVIARVEIAALIDVVLLLVLFFMLSSSFTVQNALNIEMPEARGENAFEQRSISVSLLPPPGGFDGRGAVYVNTDEASSLDDFGRRLAELQRAHPDTLVLIRPDARVESGRLLEILGAANDAGISRYQIATRPAP